MFIVVSFISYKPVLALANTSKAELKPIDSAADEESSAGDDKDWRKPIVEYLQDPSQRIDMTVR